MGMGFALVEGTCAALPRGECATISLIRCNSFCDAHHSDTSLLPYIIPPTVDLEPNIRLVHLDAGRALCGHNAGRDVGH